MTTTTRGILLATLLLFGTTVDDTIWLVPALSLRRRRAIVSVFFVLTVEAIVFVSVSLAWRARKYVKKAGHNREYLPAAVGASLCWVFCAGLLIKKWLKRRRKRREHTSSNLAGKERSEAKPGDYGSIPSPDSEKTEAESCTDIDTEITDDDSPDNFAPLTVISLTLAGTLDEIAYLPALIVGGTFSPAELSVGAALASFLIVFLITTLVNHFPAAVEKLDDIPLWLVVGCFAILLTTEAVGEYIGGGEKV
uniref:GDT1 family protein n=1 Tax=Corethron hystrix TaxID=216773 RepID=A0A7S1BDX3_9STRA|mmetsp:Transcript_23846/g.54312  ORF Transcript_23846/g.54312 Transcript_23846/m.54312 type:complete len:251 (+) Transcript_23846:82-834(+)